MHYGDSEHISKARLEIVVYKHLDLTVGNLKLGGLPEICSIYKCQHMDMYLLHELWDNFEDMFKKELKKLKPETFYGVELRVKKVGKKTKLYWYCHAEITDDMVKQEPMWGLH